MTDLDNEEPLSNVSDSSFIILEYGSPPPSINSETANEEFLEKNPNTSVVFESNKSRCNKNTPSWSCDGQSFLEGNIQEKLKELIRENNQLKETLSQNNLAIKSQLNAFYKWQQEVLKTHESHKEKFLETKDFILKLRAENLSLKNQLAESFKTINDDDLQSGKKDVCDNLNNLKIFEKLTNISKDLGNKNEVLENLKLRESLKATEKEVFKLSSDLEDSMRENNFLKQKIDELSKNSIGRLSQGELSNSEFQAEINNLMKQLEMEKSKNLHLKEKLEKANNIISKIDLNRIQGENEYLQSLGESNLTSDGQSQKLNTLQDWVTLKEENVDKANQNLIGEIKEAKCHFGQKSCQEKQKNLQELEDQFSKILKDYRALQEQLTAIQDRGENKISNLSQLLESKETELFLQQQEIDRLKEEIKKLILQYEEVEILKVQVELYQNYFNDERAARLKLAGEMEAMAEQLRLLQSKLENSGEGPKEEQNKEETDVLQSFFVPHKTKKSSFSCPLCLNTYKDHESCKKHISECFDIFTYPY